MRALALLPALVGAPGCVDCDVVYGGGRAEVAVLSQAGDLLELVTVAGAAEPVGASEGAWMRVTPSGAVDLRIDTVLASDVAVCDDEGSRRFLLRAEWEGPTPDEVRVSMQLGSFVVLREGPLSDAERLAISSEQAGELRTDVLWLPEPSELTERCPGLLADPPPQIDVRWAFDQQGRDCLAP